MTHTCTIMSPFVNGVMMYKCLVSLSTMFQFIVVVICIGGEYRTNYDLSLAIKSSKIIENRLNQGKRECRFLKRETVYCHLKV